MACRTICDLIEIIRQRPAMFVKDKSLRELEIYLYGYVACLEAHGLVEKAEFRDIFAPTKLLKDEAAGPRVERPEAKSDV